MNDGILIDYSELHSYELMQKLMRDDGSPSFLHIPASSPIHHALDIGCGDGHWVAHAAQVWGAHGTKIIGLSMPPCVSEEHTTLPKVDKENVKLLRHSMYVYIATKAAPRTIR